MHMSTLREHERMAEWMVSDMGECKLCGKNGEELTLLSANHRDLGQIMVCRECWIKLNNDNCMVWGSTGSGSTCPSCSR